MNQIKVPLWILALASVLASAALLRIADSLERIVVLLEALQQRGT